MREARLSNLQGTMQIEQGSPPRDADHRVKRVSAAFVRLASDVLAQTRMSETSFSDDVNCPDCGAPSAARCKLRTKFTTYWVCAACEAAWSQPTEARSGRVSLTPCDAIAIEPEAEVRAIQPEGAMLGI